MTEDVALQREVSERLGRPWPEVREVLERTFGRPWAECEIFISTSADKKGRTEADVIVDLVAKATERTPMRNVVRRKVVRWVGKPWRERQDPWDRFKDRVPSVEDMQRRRRRPGDLEEWSPYRPKGPEDT